MTGQAPPSEAIEALFKSLLLGNSKALGKKPSTLDLEQALERAVHALEAKDETRENRLFETRLRLAMHLSPRSAISYLNSNPRPRFRLIQEYLESSFGNHPSLSERLARDVASLLQAWDEERQAVSGYMDDILAAQGGRCNHCHFLFSTATLVRQRVDDYKPYHLAPDELCSPEVDHIESVSCLGTNASENLQVLCRLCNAGKGDGLGLDVRAELANAGLHICETSRHHRLRLFYYSVLRSGRRCATCNAPNELTIRPRRPDGAHVRTNMATICYECLEKDRLG